ncbi:hypothetical protein QTP86_024290 [Hemibagrus guttatus]|nr:hypothetical protein QTP86_024290 [Hemibagrus guttatus]
MAVIAASHMPLLESTSEEFLTLATALLLALAFLRMVGVLQVLYFDPSCLESAPRMVEAALHLRVEYVPKKPHYGQSFCRPSVFCPTSRQSWRDCTCCAQFRFSALTTIAQARSLCSLPFLSTLVATTKANWPPSSTLC